MPKHIKIIIVGHPEDQLNVMNTLLGKSFNQSSPLIQISQLQVDGQPVKIEMRRTTENALHMVADGNVLLYALPGCDYLQGVIDNADNIIREMQNKYLEAHQAHLLPILIFRDFGDKNERAAAAFKGLTTSHYQLSSAMLEVIIGEAIRHKRYKEDQPSASQPPVPLIRTVEETVMQTSLAGRNASLLTKESTGSTSAEARQTQASDSAPSSTSAAQKKRQTRIISRITGAFTRMLIGIFTGIIVYNPVSSLFAAVSRLQRDIRWMIKGYGANPNLLRHLIVLLISPIYGPLKGIFFDGLYRQAKRGWQNGFSSVFNSFSELPREANLSDLYHEEFTADRLQQIEVLETPISLRNIIAGIIISSLVIAAALAVVVLPINAAIGISAAAARYGLSSLMLWQLAVVAASAAFAVSSFLFGLGVVCNRLLHMTSKATKHKEPNYLSRFLGAFVGFCVGAITSLLVNNPITMFYGACRLILWRGVILGLNNESEKIDSRLAQFLLYPLAFILVPIITPIFYVITQPFNQAARGWKNGLLTTLGYREVKTKDNLSAYADVVSGSDEVEGRDVIVGLVVTALVAGAVLAILVPPLSIFFGIPALLTTIGLSGLAPWSLALIGAVATFVVGSLSYGIGSNLYDLAVHKQSQSDTANIDAPINSSHQQMHDGGVMGATSTASAAPSAAAALNAGSFGGVVSRHDGRKGDAEEKQGLLKQGSVATLTQG